MKMRMFGAAAIAVAALALSGCGIHTVETGERGLKVRFGQVEGEPLSEGLYMVNPFTTSVYTIDTRQQKWSSETGAYTKDVQEAKVQFTINYKLQQAAVGTVYKTVGIDWQDKLVGQVVVQYLKNTIGQWDAVDLISNRQKANDEAQKAITDALAARNVDVTGFSIRGIEFSTGFNQAVEAKVIAQQRAEQAKNQTEQIKQEANQKVISATAEAQSMKIRSDALGANPKLVEWEAVQKWNGVLPQYQMGGATPFINLNH